VRGDSETGVGGRTVRAPNPHRHARSRFPMHDPRHLRLERLAVPHRVEARMEKQVAASESGKDAKRSRVDVLRGEKEEVDADSRFDAFFGADTVEGILREEERLLLVGAVQLGVFSVFQGTRTDGGKGGLEDVELAAEVLLWGVGECEKGVRRRDAIEEYVRAPTSPLSEDHPSQLQQWQSRQSRSEAYRGGFRWQPCQ
jgi:hypothetical protein